jgi:hypothetical protein
VELAMECDDVIAKQRESDNIDATYYKLMISVLALIRYSKSARYILNNKDAIYKPVKK